MGLAANRGLADTGRWVAGERRGRFPDLPLATRAVRAGRLWNLAPASITLPEREEPYD